MFLLLLLLLLLLSQAAGVAGSLGPNTTWTILAPTNNAFVSRLNESLGITPQELLLPENRDVLVEVSCLGRIQLTLKLHD